MSNKLIYAYGVSDKAITLVTKEANLKYLQFGELFAFIKDVSADEYSIEKLKKNFSDMDWLEKHAREHVEVINDLMQERAIVPFKFGTIFTSEETLGRFIDKYSPVITDNLKKIEGKEEWSVKIYLDKSVLKEKIVEISGLARNLEMEIMNTSPGKTFLLKRKKNELIRSEIEDLTRSVGQKSYEEISAICELICIGPPLSKEMTKRPDTMVLNMTCLIKRQISGKLAEIVGKLRVTHKMKGFDFEISGPWPPFSFISMNEQNE